MLLVSPHSGSASLTLSLLSITVIWDQLDPNRSICHTTGAWGLLIDSDSSVSK